MTKHNEIVIETFAGDLKFISREDAGRLLPVLEKQLANSEATVSAYSIEQQLSEKQAAEKSNYEMQVYTLRRNVGAIKHQLAT